MRSFFHQLLQHIRGKRRKTEDLRKAFALNAVISKISKKTAKYLDFFEKYDIFHIARLYEKPIDNGFSYFAKIWAGHAPANEEDV